MKKLNLKINFKLYENACILYKKISILIIIGKLNKFLLFKHIFIYIKKEKKELERKIEDLKRELGEKDFEMKIQVREISYELLI